MSISLSQGLGAVSTNNFPLMAGVLVDRSSSMSPYTSVVTEGVDYLVSEQQKIKGLGQLTLAEFASDYNNVLEQDFSKLDPNFHYNYSPDGSTCLYDSLAKMTSDFEEKLEQTKKKHSVVIAVMTDGEDTGCKVSAEEIKAIVEQKMKEGWKYLLLGALPNTLEIADTIGIPKDQVAIFGSGNIAGSIDLISRKITEMRKGKTLAISAAERASLALPPPKKEL